MKLTGKRLVLGVTGSIAAYKAVGLLRTLLREGADVSVVMTQAKTLEDIEALLPWNVARPPTQSVPA